MRRIFLVITLLLLLAGCTSKQTATPTPAPNPAPTQTRINPSPTLTVPDAEGGKIPNFAHVVTIVLENEAYDAVIGSKQMPFLNELAKNYVLLKNYYAVSHPSLPNYIAMVGGNTFNITSDCNSCWLNEPSLPDLIEKSGRTWRAYQEDMPQPCYVGDHGEYAQKHNPFIYFNNIRLNPIRCFADVVPLSQLDDDLKANKLPNYIFITPNLCHSGHDCDQKTVDDWLKKVVELLQDSPSFGGNSLIAIIFDEGKTSSSQACCGLKKTGGQVAAVLVSPLAKPKFQDVTPLTHYSLLKTILKAWNLPDLGDTALPAIQPILAPWQP